MCKPIWCDRFFEERTDGSIKTHGKNGRILFKLKNEVIIEGKNIKLLHIGDGKILRLKSVLVYCNFSAADEDDSLWRAYDLRNLLFQGNNAIINDLFVVLVPSEKDVVLFFAELQMLQQVYFFIYWRVIYYIGLASCLLLEFLKAHLPNHRLTFTHPKALPYNLLWSWTIHQR